MQLAIKDLSFHILTLFVGLFLTFAIINHAHAETIGIKDVGSAIKDAVKDEANMIKNGVKDDVQMVKEDVQDAFWDSAQGFFDDIGLGSIARRVIGRLSGDGYCGQYQRKGIGASICRMVASSTGIPGFIRAIAYLIGIFFSVTALVKLKDHVINPDRAPLSDSIKRFVAGGLFFSLPSVTSTLQELYKDKSYGFGGSRMIAHKTTDGGLDGSIVGFIGDIWQPLLIAIGAFGYIAGLVLTVVAISRLVKTAQEGAKGPAGFGTIMTFFTAGALFSLDSLMGVFSQSLFGSKFIRTYPTLSSGLSTGVDNVDGRIEGVLTSIVAFVALVGWISFVRGFFIVRDVAEGNQQASLMAATTHLIAGAVAVNLGPFLMAIQSTFGIGGFGINFH